MSAAIALTSGMRNSLNSLSDLDSQIATTNKRLSTGKKVNDVLDNASVFFQAEGLNRRAQGLDALIDSQNLGVRTLEKAISTVNAGTKLLETAQGLARQALTFATGSTERNNVLSQISTILTASTGQFDQLTADAQFSGRNLLRTGAANDLKVVFNLETGAAQTSFTSTAADLKIGGGVTVTATNFAAGADDVKVNALIGELTTAIGATQSRANTLSAGLSTIQIRLDFTKQDARTNRTAADQLTLADLNEEGARLTTLQNRQQLAVTALSLAQRSDQAILRLF
jgi:flagellin-like hook-associated protein FlgL